jgi:hypothetical protein
MTIENIENHMAKACNCGSVNFVLLKSGGIECNKCGTVLQNIKWDHTDERSDWEQAWHTLNNEVLQLKAELGDLPESQAEMLGTIKQLRYRIHELEGEVIGYKRILDEASSAAAMSEPVKPIGYISKTGHGTYFRESITPELAALTHGGNPMWTPVGPITPAAAVSEPVGVKGYAMALNEVALKLRKRYEHDLLSTPLWAEFEKARNKFAASIATPPAAPPPLSVKQIHDWWASENGLEDCDMCKLEDFAKVVQAVEKAHNIGAKE